MITYTICGSMKFAEEMKKIAYQLEIEQGYNILQCVYVEDITKLSEDNIKRLEQAHYKKIDISDGIYVVNPNGYIGESVKKEIEYAKKHNKKVLYHYPTNQLVKSSL